MTSDRFFLTFRRTATWVALAVALVFVGGVSARVSAVSAELTQSYTAASKIEPGALVSLDDQEGKTVVIADQANSDRLVGVLVDKNSSTMAINTSENSVQVATSGRVIALVSALNGDIKKGDILSLSPVAGVAAKATAGTRIVGVAQQDFSKSSDGATMQQIKDKYGKMQDIAFGSLPIIVSVGSKVGVVETAQRSGIFGWFEALAGKSVSTLRLVICAFVSVITLIVLFIIIFSSVQSTIYGVSRNPFAKASIFEAFAKVVVMSLVVATLAMVIIYVILRV